MASLICFDTETSGLKPGQIGQLSAIITDEALNVKGINYFFEIDSIEPGAEALLGRGVDWYREKSKGLKFKDVASEIAEIFNGNIWAGHNVKFDENFLSSELWRCGLVAKPVNKFDTMTNYKDILKIKDRYGRIKYPKLTELVDGLALNKDKLSKYCATLFGNDETAFHDSRFDTTATFVAMQMFNELNLPLEKRAWTNTFR